MFKLASARLGLLAGISSAAVVGGTCFADAVIDSSRPQRGVYIWGDNSHGLIGDPAMRVVKAPVRVPYFDNKTLRTVGVAPEYAVAVLANGDVVQWSNPTNAAPVLKGKNIVQLYMTPTSHRVVALGKDGKIWSWSNAEKPVAWKADAKLGWFEKFVDLRCGVDHVAAITNHGRAFTGFLRTAEDEAEHHGQLGIAHFPHFEPPPPPNVLHSVKLMDSPVTKIACGNYHTLFLNNRGELWGAGSNKFGQLMLPYTYKTVKTSVPTRIQEGVVDIAAGSLLTYLRRTDGNWYVAGDGEFGQFGTGSFSQVQSAPISIPLVNNIREFNEKLGRVAPVQVVRWAIGDSYTFAQLDNPGRDWLVWGSSGAGQLGHEKLSRIVKPQPVAKILVDYHSLGATTFVAGDKVSACFSDS